MRFLHIAAVKCNYIYTRDRKLSGKRWNDNKKLTNMKE